MYEFLRRLEGEYGNGYFFDPANFHNMSTPLDVVCPDHGVFVTTPANLIYNAGCPKCRGVDARGYPARRGKGDNPKKRPGRVPRVKYYHFYIIRISPDEIKFGVSPDVITPPPAFVRTFRNDYRCNAIKRIMKSAFKTTITHSKHYDDIVKIINSFPPHTDPYNPAHQAQP